MSARVHAQAKATPKPSFTPVRPGLLQRCGATHCPPGQCGTNKKKRPGLQRYAAGPAGPTAVPPIVDEVLRSSGRPLDPATRAYMEPRFGHDFSRVRVHSDARAADSAHAVNALAYTVGRDVVFGVGRYAPGTSAGRRLIAHELTHVVQQRDGFGLARHPLEAGPNDGTYERDADQVATRVLSAPATEGPGGQGISGTDFGFRLEAGKTESGPRASGKRLQRTAASCPDDWAATVSADHTRALGMIDIARGKLSSYNGTTPTEVQTALNTHFKASGTAFAAWVNFNLGFLRLIAPLAGYDCEDTSSWWCKTGNKAKTFWCVPGIDIRVCQPVYFNLPDEMRSNTLIHEWVHKYGCNFDIGYSNEPDYKNQWTITALLNADPFSDFVLDVQ